jgi:diguanylate cyclase (GGDEF)-like protein
MRESRRTASFGDRIPSLLGNPGRWFYYGLLTAAASAFGLLYLRLTTANASVLAEVSLNGLIYLYVFGATAGIFLTIGYVLRRQIDELRRISTTDPLTGLQNRRGMQAALRASLDRLDQSGPLALLLIDVDGLKEINDELGHASGDRVLRSVAAAIRLTVRETDIGSRWGGDEFAIVAPRTALDAADRLVERLQRHLTRHSRSADIAVSVSVGVAIAEKGASVGTDVEELMQIADGSLYRAKDLRHRRKFGDPRGRVTGIETYLSPAARTARRAG